MVISVHVPEGFLVDSDPAAVGRRLKLYAALRMFQSGEISAGAAAELAEVDRFTFVAECRCHGISVVNYPADDLSAEIALLRDAP
jgi:predicted HTH domain antitoxin